jgi:hypothetical protein
MKFLLIFFFFVGQVASAQDKSLLQHKKYFDRELKAWTATFSNFNLSSFKATDTAAFENNYAQDWNYLKEFLATYKPIITYSPDSSKFVDIYSYQLNLEKKGKYYYANQDIDQAILLFDRKKKYWDRIYFGTSSHWIDEVVWISNTQFIMVGITKNSSDKKKPLILVGDVNKQAIVTYLTNNENSIQTDRGYSSRKLKRIDIKGL